MNDHAGNIKESIPEQMGKKKRLLQKLYVLSTITEQLEPTQLDRCNEELLDDKLQQLETIKKDIRELSSKKILPKNLKKEFSRVLEAAVTELSVAKDQFTAEGRTREFYESLSQFRQYIERALEHGEEYQEQLAWIETFESKEDQKEDVFDAHTKALRLVQGIDFLTQRLLLEKREIADEDYSYRMKGVLSALQESLDSLRELFVGHVYRSEESAPLLYRLRILLNNIDQQIERLLALLPTYRESEERSVEEILAVSKEVGRKVEVIQRRCNELSQVIDALLQQGYVYPDKRRIYAVK